MDKSDSTQLQSEEETLWSVVALDNKVYNKELKDRQQDHQLQLDYLCQCLYSSSIFHPLILKTSDLVVLALLEPLTILRAFKNPKIPTLMELIQLNLSPMDLDIRPRLPQQPMITLHQPKKRSTSTKDKLYKLVVLTHLLFKTQTLSSKLEVTKLLNNWSILL